MQNQNNHFPVLLESFIKFLEDNQFVNFSGQKKVLDLTFGGGSYSRRFLDYGFLVFSSDLDPIAKDFASQINNPNFSFLKADFKQSLESHNNDSLDLIIADLGFSTNQLNFSKRGFSYQNKEVFDIRFDSEKGKPAWQVLSLMTAIELKSLIYQNSGEKLAGRLGIKLFEKFNGNKTPIYASELAEFIKNQIPAKFAKNSNSILSRVWQAFRICVNNEFEQLNNILDIAPKKLKSGGFLFIISFHSLEDKIVTKYLRKLAIPKIDEFGNHTFEYKLLTKKAMLPTEFEVFKNPPSRSALGRILQKV